MPLISELLKPGQEVQVRILEIDTNARRVSLSIRRATSVKDEMVRQGLTADTIAIEGKSFHDPLVPTGPGVREPKNRRAVIDLGG